MSKLTSAELKPDAVPAYTLAGNATITLLSGNTDRHFTYKIKKSRDKEKRKGREEDENGEKGNQIPRSHVHTFTRSRFSHFPPLPLILLPFILSMFRTFFHLPP